MMKWIICLIVVMPVPMINAQVQTRSGFQGKITITSINNKPVASRRAEEAPAPDKEVQPSPFASLYPSAETRARRASPIQTTGPTPSITIDPVVEVRGEVVGLDQNQAELHLVQLAAIRLYDGSCYLLGSDVLEKRGAKAGIASWRWVVEDVRFPLPDYGKGFEVVAILVRKGADLPEGLVDYDTVLRYALAKTDQVHCNMRCEARVEITHVQDVTGEIVQLMPGPAPPLEVGWTATIKGKADRSKDSFVYLVVHPITSDQRWVMEQKGSSDGRDWTETGYFGREGLDTGELFRVQAIVSKRPIAHGAYPPHDWHRLEENICGTSSEVLTRRRTGPGDLVIEKIDNKVFVGNDPVPSDMECQILGSIENPQPEHMLEPGELVWLLFRPAGDDEQWSVGALAFPLGDGFIWRVPVLKFPKPGRYKLMAVAARTDLPLQNLSQRDWYALARARIIRRLSRIVTVDAGVSDPVKPASSTTSLQERLWDWVRANLLIVLLVMATLVIIWQAIKRFRANLIGT